MFLGHGNSKKGAKIACAEQCLKWLGLDVPGEIIWLNVWSIVICTVVNLSMRCVVYLSLQKLSPIYSLLSLGEPGAEQEGAEEVGVDLSQVDTSADNPITAVPLTNPVPQTSNPAPQSGQSGADTQPQKPFQSKSWNKAPGSGRKYKRFILLILLKNSPNIFIFVCTWNDVMSQRYACRVVFPVTCQKSLFEILSILVKVVEDRTIGVVVEVEDEVVQEVRAVQSEAEAVAALEAVVVAVAEAVAVAMAVAVTTNIMTVIQLLDLVNILR